MARPASDMRAARREAAKAVKRGLGAEPRAARIGGVVATVSRFTPLSILMSPSRVGSGAVPLIPKLLWESKG